MGIVRLEYLSGYLLLPVTAYLLDSFRFTNPIPYFKRGLLGLALVMVAFTAFAPDYYLEMSYTWFEIMVVIYVIFAFLTIVQGIKKKVEGVSFIVLGILFLIFGALMELFATQFHYVLYLCSFMFVMLLAISVMTRFATITSRKEHLETAVLTDPLTQLGNRTALFNTLKSATMDPKESQLFILFIDLNKFKHINDVYGHKVGDAVLIEAASRFRRSTRSSDKIFRYGGDEFIILAEIASSFSVETLIQRIRSNFETPMVFDEVTLTISLAIGYEVYVPGVNNPDEVLKSSDLKMYENKRVTSD
jgi:diguanylate cyclase (GGDEF)-like protein